MNRTNSVLGFFFLFSLGCASMSPREVRTEEVKLEATEEAELSPAPESLSLGAMDTASGNEVRVLSIDGVVERPGKQLEVDNGGLGVGNQKGFKPSFGARSSVRGQKAKPRSAPQRMESARGAKTTCGDVLGGDYWAERLRVDPALQRFFQAQSQAPFEVSVYRRVSSSPEEFVRVFHMEEPARRISFVVETPSKRTEVSDFVYEVQLLNRSDETSEYCLKHW